MDGDSIPRCTIAARSLRGVLLRESREYVGVPSPQLVATSVVSHLTQRSGSDSRGQRRKWATGGNGTRRSDRNSSVLRE